MTDEKTTPAAEPQAEAAPSTEGTQPEKEAVKNPKKEKAEKKKDLAAELEAAKAKADAAKRKLRSFGISCCAPQPSMITSESARPANRTRRSATA